MESTCIQTYGYYGIVEKSGKRVFGKRLAKAELKPEFEKLLTIPGGGKILALTIMYGTGDISRFKKAGNYTSY